MPLDCARSLAVVPVLRGHLGPGGGEPAHVLDAELGVEGAGEEAPPAQHRQGLAQDQQALGELGEVPLVLADRLPVDPGDLVVLAIGVVVALLGAGELVAGEQHRRAAGQE
jgi:hypothetical protein